MMRFDIEKTSIIPMKNGSVECVAFFYVRGVRYYTIVRFYKDGVELSPMYTDRGVSKMNEKTAEFIHQYFYNRFKHELLKDPLYRLRMLSFGFHLEGGEKNEKF